MELLSEMRTPAQALNYALARERGQQNQREILRGNNSNYQHARQSHQYYPHHKTQNNTHNVGDVEDHSRPIITTIAQQRCPNVTYAKNQDTSQKCVVHKFPHCQKTEDNFNNDKRIKQEM